MLKKRPATIAVVAAISVVSVISLYYLANRPGSENTTVKFSVLDQQDIDQIVVIKAKMQQASGQDEH